jgi:hypothetical protein
MLIILIMTYTKHEELIKLFPTRKRWWQGCDPITACYLFIGLDANFAPNIQAHYPKVVDYLNDYNQFIDDYEVHHPFLLNGYRGSGRKYHEKFVEIGFTREQIRRLSFVELLHIPTTGQSNLKAGDLLDAHLDWLSNILSKGVAEHVFICPAVIRLMLKKSNYFPWVVKEPERDGNLKIWHRDGLYIYIRCIICQSASLDR